MSAAAPTLERAPNLPVTVRIPALDGVRGVASLMVVYVHYVVMTIPTPPGTPLAFLGALGGFGSTGVDLFFVLSGFLLAGILLDSKKSEHYFRTFYVRRVARIFPLYWCVLLSFLVLDLFRPGEQVLIGGPVPAWTYAAFIQNYYMGLAGTFGAVWLAVTWSLAIEEQFYLILPLAIRLSNRKILTSLAVLCFVGAPLLRLAVLYWKPVPSLSAAVWSICRADALAAGVLAAVISRTPSLCARIASLPRLMPAAVVVCLLVSGGVFLVNRSSPVGTYVLMHPIVDASYALAVLCVAILQDSWLARLMRNGALMHAGTLCYATYLLHLIVIYAVFSLLLGTSPQISSAYTALLVVASTVATFALAQVSWVYLEKPFIRLGHRFQY